MENGLQYGYMNNEILKLIDTDAGRDAVESSGGFLGWIKTMIVLTKQVKPLQQLMIADAWESAMEARPDLIIYHPKAMSGPHIAEKMGIPRIMSVPLPIFTPTAEFPSMVFPNLKLGGWYNRLTYTLSVRLAWMQYRGIINPWRESTLRLSPAARTFDEMKLADGRPTPTLYPYSEHVVPRPYDWPASTVAPGYWFLDRLEAWRPSDELQAFLDAGEPPVYIGFGSMAGRDAVKKAQAAIGALQKSGQRGIIATGWGGMSAGNLPDSIFKITAVPHKWLFERVKAVVHHGGAGTTGAGLRAGKPTIICPFVGDQPFWGKRVAELGVGAEPIPQKKLKADNLAVAVDQVTSNATIKQRAEALGKKIRSEDGIARGIDCLNLKS
jgi:sterol 3beta-glucosyltransferase